MTWLDQLELNTVVVFVDDGPSVKGVKSAVHDDCLVLCDAYALEDKPTMLGGDLVIPRERVVMIQRVANGNA